MAKNLSEAQRRQKAKGMENTMRSDHIIKSKVKSQMSKDLETSKRSDHIIKSNVKCQKSNVKCRMSWRNTILSDTMQQTIKSAHQWQKNQAKHPTPKTKQKKTAPFGAALMQ
jgi:hypothetical protein